MASSTSSSKNVSLSTSFLLISLPSFTLICIFSRSFSATSKMSWHERQKLGWMSESQQPSFHVASTFRKSKVHLTVKRLQCRIARRFSDAVNPSWYPATRLVMSFHLIVVMHVLELRTEHRWTVSDWAKTLLVHIILCSQHVYFITYLFVRPPVRRISPGVEVMMDYQTHDRWKWRRYAGFWSLLTLDLNGRGSGLPNCEAGN